MQAVSSLSIATCSCSPEVFEPVRPKAAAVLFLDARRERVIAGGDGRSSRRRLRSAPPPYPHLSPIASKLGAVVAEVSRLSMTASRRLQLAAESSGVIGLALRRLAPPGPSR
jgi:hypothetical protein